MRRGIASKDAPLPRRIRIDLPAIPQHIVQRGNDRQPCFYQDIDRIRTLQNLREVALAKQCGIHAYVLMTNHVHLLVTPTAPGQVARLMQSLGRRYVRYVNARYHRSGTLWEGRYKASAVMHDDYVLRCQRTIELIPLRARMVADSLDYRWSSHRGNSAEPADPLITPHRAWRALGTSDTERRVAWRALLMETVDPDETDAIRLHLQRQHLYCPDGFRVAIEAQLGRTAGLGKIETPRMVRSRLEDANGTLL